MRRILTYCLIIGFLLTSFGPMPLAKAQEVVLPPPGTMVRLSPAFTPPILKGIKVHPDNPFRFDFVLEEGDTSQTSPTPEVEEVTKLIKYFLASITTPEKDLWVNLSPYEKDRIVPESFGQTEMGRDLLAQDYMLKQITASLIYPEDEIGKKFWKRIYEEAARKFGSTNVPVNTFNKVWVIPEKAVVYENASAATAYVVESKLKVMLESDYLALEKSATAEKSSQANDIGKQIVREIVIPALTTEVNEGKNFAQLRQVYHSLILAAWYKKKIKDSILIKVYADKNKVSGVNIDDPQEKQKIYERYLQAFKKGAYNYIKEETDPVTHQTIPRKYFSGGKNFARTTATTQIINEQNASPAMMTRVYNSLKKMGTIFMIAATLNSAIPTAGLAAQTEIKAPSSAPVYRPIVPPFKTIKELQQQNPAVEKIMSQFSKEVNEMASKGQALAKVKDTYGFSHLFIEKITQYNALFRPYKLFIEPNLEGNKLLLRPHYVAGSTIYNSVVFVVPLDRKIPDTDTLLQGKDIIIQEGRSYGSVTIVDINNIEIAVFVVQSWLAGRIKLDSNMEQLYRKLWPNKNASIEDLRAIFRNIVVTHEYEHSQGGDEVSALLADTIVGPSPVASLTNIQDLSRTADEEHKKAANKVLELTGLNRSTEFKSRVLDKTLPEAEEYLRIAALRAYIKHRNKPFFDAAKIEAAARLKMPIANLLAIDRESKKDVDVKQREVLNKTLEKTKIDRRVVAAIAGADISSFLKEEGKITDKEKDEFLGRVRGGVGVFTDILGKLQAQTMAHLQKSYIDKADQLAKQGKTQEANTLARAAESEHKRLLKLIDEAAKLFNKVSEDLNLTQGIQLQQSSVPGSVYATADTKSTGTVLYTVAAYRDPLKNYEAVSDTAQLPVLADRAVLSKDAFERSVQAQELIAELAGQYLGVHENILPTTALSETQIQDIASFIIPDLFRVTGQNDDFLESLNNIMTTEGITEYRRKFGHFNVNDLVMVFQRVYTLSENPLASGFSKSSFGHGVDLIRLNDFGESNYTVNQILELAGFSGESWEQIQADEKAMRLLREGRGNELLEYANGRKFAELLPILKGFFQTLSTEARLMETANLTRILEDVNTTLGRPLELLPADQQYQVYGQLARKLQLSLFDDFVRTLHVVEFVRENYNRYPTQVLGRGGNGLVYAFSDAQGVTQAVKANIISNTAAAQSFYTNLSTTISRLKGSTRFAENYDLVALSFDHEVLILEFNELVSGPSAEEIASDKNLSLDQALDLIVQLSDIYRELDQKGLVNRDDLRNLSNVLVDDTNQVKFIDYEEIVGKESLSKEHAEETKSQLLMALVRILSGMSLRSFEGNRVWEGLKMDFRRRFPQATESGTDALFGFFEKESVMEQGSVVDFSERLTLVIDNARRDFAMGQGGIDLNAEGTEIALEDSFEILEPDPSAPRIASTGKALPTEMTGLSRSSSGWTRRRFTQGVVAGIAGAWALANAPGTLAAAVAQLQTPAAKLKSAREIVTATLNEILKTGSMSSGLVNNPDRYWSNIFSQAGGEDYFDYVVDDIQLAIDEGLKPYNEGKEYSVTEFAKLALTALNNPQKRLEYFFRGAWTNFMIAQANGKPLAKVSDIMRERARFIDPELYSMVNVLIENVNNVLDQKIYDQWRLFNERYLVNKKELYGNLDSDKGKDGAAVYFAIMSRIIEREIVNDQTVLLGRKIDRVNTRGAIGHSIPGEKYVFGDLLEIDKISETIGNVLVSGRTYWTEKEFKQFSPIADRWIKKTFQGKKSNRGWIRNFVQEDIVRHEVIHKLKELRKAFYNMPNIFSINEKGREAVTSEIVSYLVQMSLSKHPALALLILLPHLAQGRGTAEFYTAMYIFNTLLDRPVNQWRTTPDVLAATFEQLLSMDDTVLRQKASALIDTNMKNMGNYDGVKNYQKADGAMTGEQYFIQSQENPQYKLDGKLLNNATGPINELVGDTKDIYKVTTEDGQIIAVKVNKDPAKIDYLINFDEKNIIDLQEFNGPEYYGRVSINIDGQLRLGLAMELIDGVDLDSMVYHAAKPGFAITQQHLASANELFGKLEEKGRSFPSAELVSNNFILTPDGRVRPIDMPVLIAPPANRDKFISEVIEPIQKKIGSLVQVQIPADWTIEPSKMFYDQGTDPTRKILPTKYAVSVVIMNEKGEVLFAKRNPHEGGQWSLPSSFIDVEDDPEAMNILSNKMEASLGVKLNAVELIGKRMGYRGEIGAAPWQLLMHVVFAKSYSGQPYQTGIVHESGMPKYTEFGFFNPKEFLTGKVGSFDLDTAGDCTSCFGTILHHGSYKEFEEAFRSTKKDGAVDNALLSGPGGINFNADKTNQALQIKNSAGEIKFNPDPAMLEQLENTTGFMPVIINIQPMNDLKLFLGLTAPPGSSALASAT